MFFLHVKDRLEMWHVMVSEKLPIDQRQDRTARARIYGVGGAPGEGTGQGEIVWLSWL